MDYYFEQLGDERFQKLCQAILTLNFPDVLCLPVGQPDGGRDAIVRSPSNNSAADIIIFQVKFVKDPQAKDSREFIKSIIKSEKDKVSLLKERGALRYYLITNASGTSHLDSGSIDIVNKTLSSELDIDAHCWWRDDLIGRIDANSGLKWSFPEILKATDLLENLLCPSNTPNSKRISDVIRAYMAYQAKHDAQLKFKQVELQKGIIDQYVDIPLKFLASMNETQEANQAKISTTLSIDTNVYEEDEDYYDDEVDDYENHDDTYGALQLMINPAFSKSFETVVIEGAPGQGKSTATQYLCQINRLALLGKKDELKKIEKAHLPTEARVPFRIDLRDYASWLSGKNPFMDSDVDLTPKFNPILESFIAAQINRYTGSSFDVDDLTSLSKKSQLLIVLDGFDEVADIKIRNKIVSEVSDAAIRISENALSSQIIVTSRPTAFANSPGFPRTEWQHVKLLPLSKTIIELYAKKWLNGRILEQKEKDDILSVLQDKLTQSHVRDLARNPMQLAILLALISVQGASLPDKRTALYDNYIDIFLNRESEKSTIVRDHRDLLVQIHRYLAWVLQSEAEEKSESGNISEGKLRVILKNFLFESGHSTDLVDELFSGMVERVVALVSRVQGTFEFEVQPLREYFAARYLYDTAPYSPAGTTFNGTLPERFDAIARNFYWLNVTRFYAGCYSSGELPSLIYGLEELAESSALRSVSQPSRLGILLLKDYVFNQQPKLAYRVVSTLTNGLGFRALLADLWMSRNDHSNLTIPSGISRNLLVEKCKSLIESSSQYDTIHIASRVLSQNSTYENQYKFWNELREKKSSITTINRIGSTLGIYEKITKSEIIELMSQYGNKVLIPILRHQRLDLLENDNIEFKDIFINFAKQSGGGFFYFTKHALQLEESIWLATSALILASGYFTSNFGEDNPERSIRSLSESGIFKTHTLNLDYLFLKQESSETPNIFSNAIISANELYNSKLTEIKNNIDPWNQFIENLSYVWGKSCTLENLSLIVAHSYQGDVIYANSNSLLHKALHFKANISNPAWTSDQIAKLIDLPDSHYFFLGALITWSTPKTILSCSESVSAMIDNMSDKKWQTLITLLGPHGNIDRSTFYDLDADDIESLKLINSERLASLICIMVSTESKDILFNSHLENYRGPDAYIRQLVINMSIKKSWSTQDNWSNTLEMIKSGYKINILSNLYEYRSDGKPLELPIEVANTICEDPYNYPVSVVKSAESIVNAAIGQAVVPVGKIASSDNWFNHEI